MAENYAKKSTTREAKDAKSVEGKPCRIPGCPQTAAVRGLCEAHWCTHRGMADAEPVSPAVPEVAQP